MKDIDTPPSLKGLLTSCILTYLPNFIPEKVNNKEEGNGQNEGQYSFY
jgi:hypothetical protein